MFFKTDNDIYLCAKRKVPLSSSNAAIFGELEIYYHPLYISRYCKIIKYWCKIVQSENIILNRLYTLAVKDCLSGYTNWVSRVQKLLDDYGFSEVFLNVNTCNSFVKFFTSIFKSRLIDCFRQEWFGSIDRNRVLDEYKIFKVNFIYEEYLDSVPHNFKMFYY